MQHLKNKAFFVPTIMFFIIIFLSGILFMFYQLLNLNILVSNYKYIVESEVVKLKSR